MKTFEENLDDWLEGRLDEKEAASFEATLPEISVADLEKQDEPRLGALLKQQLTPSAMANGEFFQHQLNQQIDRETHAAAPAIPERHVRESWWSIGRLVWTGTASLAIFCICTFFVIRDKNVAGQSAYLTQIINARVDPVVSPDATISMFESKEDKVTVLWVDGLQSLPSEYAAK